MRAIAILAALAMVAGLFLPWLNPETAGVRLVPWDLLKSLEPTVETAQKFVSESPVELLAFLATFVLAALFGLLAMLGAPSRLLAFLAGGGAVGFVAFGALKLKDKAAVLGIPVPEPDKLADFARSIPEVFGLGAMAWGAGALVLLLTALVGYGER